MSEYHATLGPLGRAQADELGRWLATYAVQVAGLTVQYELPDGRLVTDHGLADVVTRQAGVLSGGALAGGVTGTAVVGAGCGPLLAALLAPLAPFLLPVLGLSAVAAPVLDRHTQQHVGHPQAVATHVTFSLAGVSARRRRWTEYLLAIWVARHGWQMVGWQHPGQQVAGAHFAATHAGYPPAWATQPRPRGAGRGRTSRSTGRAGRGWLSRLDELLH